MDHYAGFGRRLAAFGLDYLPVSAYIAALAGAGWFLSRRRPNARTGGLFASPLARNLSAFVSLVLPVGLYFAVSESSKAQATWGKRKMGLIVVRDGNGRLGLGQSLVRSLGRFLPWQVAHTALFAWPGWPLAPENPPFGVVAGMTLSGLGAATYIAFLLLNPTHRTPYDLLAGSAVVRVPARSPGELGPHPDTM